MSQPPAYQEALRQLEILKSVPLSLEVRCTAQNAIEKELVKPEITQSCLKEVRQLVNDVIKIDQAFERVKTDLGKIDNSNMRCKPVGKLQPVWMTLQQRLAILLWDSRVNARKTGAYIKEFINVILPGLEDIRSNTDYRNAMDDLKEFTGRRDPFPGRFGSREEVNQTHRHSPAFNDFRRDVACFKNTFDLFAETQGAELHDDVVTLYGVIDRLNLEIECCETMIRGMSVTLDVAVTAASAGRVASLVTLGLVGPATTLKVFFAGATAALTEFKSLIAFIPKSIEYRDEISGAHTEANDLKANMQILERIRITLEDHEAGITDTCGRIDRFAAIWFYVAHDAELLAADLKAVLCAESDLSRQAFVTRLKLIKGTYSVLANGLREYTSQIDRHSFRFAHGCFV